MSDEAQDTIEVKSAFEAYRTDPGGDVRVDAAAIAGAGRRRLRRIRVAGGAAGVAVLAAGALVVPHLAGGRHEPSDRSVIAAGASLPSTGRPAIELFTRAPGSRGSDIRSGGDGAALGTRFATGLDAAQPTFLDPGWQPGDGGKARIRWALLTWVKDGKAAEALVYADSSPAFIAIFPPPYRSCSQTDQAGGRRCEVREVKGKGWLKITGAKDGDPAKLVVSLMRRTGTYYTAYVTGGAATSAPLAEGRKPLGSLPVSEKAVTDALTALP
jgi:hypothetical protein